MRLFVPFTRFAGRGWMRFSFVLSLLAFSITLHAQPSAERYDVYTGTLRVGNKGKEIEIEKLEKSFRTTNFPTSISRSKNTFLVDQVKLTNANLMPISVFEPESGPPKIRSRTAGVLDFDAIVNASSSIARTNNLNQKIIQWDKSLQDYDKAFVDVVKTPKPAKADIQKVLLLNDRLQDNIENCFVALAKESLAAPNSLKLQAALATIENSWASSKEEQRGVIQIDKATFGDKKHRDVYSAAHYEAIFSSSRSIGKVQDIGNIDNWGSCVFIGNDYFLTAGHVLQNKSSSLFEAVFWSGISQQPTVSCAFDVVIDFRNQTNSNAKRMDLLLCKLRVSTNTIDTIVSAAQPKRDLVVDQGTPCLECGTPVYVIGFPNIANVGKGIHDNCSVVIQRLVPAGEIYKHYARLTLLDRLDVCKVRDAVPSLDNRIRDLADLFKALYGYNVGDSGGKPDGYIARYDGMEILGIDSDTSGGDSGGGVFDKQSGNLVGIFLGGIPDNQSADKADAQKFERVLPVEEFWNQVKAELDKK